MPRKTNSQYPYLAGIWDDIFVGNEAGRRAVADHVATVRWEDLRAPATGISILGFGTDPSLDSNTGHRLFSATTTETLFIFMQMQHNQVRGLTLSPHVHWIKEASGTVVWQLEYKLYSIGGAYPANYTTTTTSTVTTEYGAVSPAVDVHTLSVFPVIDTSSLTGVSAMIECKVSRLGGDASDDYAQTARFVEFDIHVPLIGHGSTEVSSGDYTTADLGGG